MKVRTTTNLNDGMSNAPPFDTAGTPEDIAFTVADELSNDEGRPLVGATVTIEVLP